MSAFRELAKQRQEAQQSGPSLGCGANGCPCRGSLSSGGDRYFCAHHFFSPSDNWPLITERLREFSWLLEFHDELQGMFRRAQDWRTFAMRFWQGNEDAELLQPNPAEEAVPYLNRMRDELGFRAGVNKRPTPRLPQEQKGRRGTFVNGEPMRKAA